MSDGGENWRSLPSPRAPGGRVRECYVRVKGLPQQQKRFPAETLERVWQAWLAGTRAELLAAMPVVGGSGTLEGDAIKWLARQPEARRADLKGLIACWVIDAGLGLRPRHSIM